MANKPTNNQPPVLPIEYDTRATFLDVQSKKRGGTVASKQAKGVLDRLSIRQPARSGVNGDIKMHFLRSTVHESHSAILEDAGYDIGDQPIQGLLWKGHKYYVAGRYVSRPGRRGPIEAALMFGSSELGQDVTAVRGYPELRFTVALAAGYLIASQELRHDDAPNAQYAIRIVDNFQTPGPVEQNMYTGDNLRALTQKLIAG